MGATAGWKARVRVPGAAVPLTDEATTANGARTQYQITNAAKRVLDPQLAVVVQTSPDGTTWSTATGYTLNRLTGTVTFTSARPAGTQIRIHSGSYLPLSTVAGAHGYSWTLTAPQLDASDFDGLATTGGYASEKVTALHDASGTLDQWDQRDTYFSDALMNADVIVIEIMSNRAASAPDILFWALLDKQGLQSSPTTLNAVSISWTGVADADRRVISD